MNYYSYIKNVKRAFLAKEMYFHFNNEKNLPNSEIDANNAHSQSFDRQHRVNSHALEIENILRNKPEKIQGMQSTSIHFP